jgi:hypothetical protein
MFEKTTEGVQIALLVILSLASFAYSYVQIGALGVGGVGGIGDSLTCAQQFQNSSQSPNPDIGLRTVRIFCVDK